MDDQSSQPVAVQLEYQSPMGRIVLPPARKSVAFRIGLFCWVLPLLAGLTIFIAWLLFPSLNELAVFAGAFTIQIGSLCSAAGAVCAIVVMATRWGRSIQPWKQAIWPGCGLLMLLASNFAVAFAVIMAVGYISEHSANHHIKL